MIPKSQYSPPSSSQSQDDKMRPTIEIAQALFQRVVDQDMIEENVSDGGSDSSRPRRMTVDNRVDLEKLTADLHEANFYTKSDSATSIIVKEIKSLGSSHDDRVIDRSVTSRQLYNDYIDYIRKIDKDCQSPSLAQCDLARQVKIHEIRKLEFELNPHEERSIYIRRHCVLVALDPIRAMITAEKVILFIAHGADG